MKARKWVIAKHFEGVPKDSDLELREEDLPELKNGEVLLEALYLSVDPYMRPYAARLPVGSTMIGQQLAKLSAYFGFLRICEPKPGETVFVNSAAGIVGSVVGQIAKIKGCHVIGCAGSDDKCKWLKDELGFDSVFNYKTDKLEDALKKAAPNGIDCYFDNVGGDMSTTVVEKFMNRFGRVSCCGALSAYNATTPPIGHQLFQTLVFKELKMQGFIVNSFTADAPAAAAELLQWVKEGKLKWREDVVDGFENARTAMYGLLEGKYTGKVLVKA